MPFARIAKIWDHEDQSVSLTKGDGFAGQDERPTVIGLGLDVNFSAIDPNQ